MARENFFEFCWCVAGNWITFNLGATIQMRFIAQLEVVPKENNVIFNKFLSFDSHTKVLTRNNGGTGGIHYIYLVDEYETFFPGLPLCSSDRPWFSLLWSRHSYRVTLVVAKEWQEKTNQMAGYGRDSNCTIAFFFFVSSFTLLAIFSAHFHSPNSVATSVGFLPSPSCPYSYYQNHTCSNSWSEFWYSSAHCDFFNRRTWRLC